MKRAISILILLLTILVALSGCRRPLEYYYGLGAKVVVKVIWKAEVYPDGVKPTGVTIYYFRNGEFYTKQTTANVDSCTVDLIPGRYKFYMITQSPEEYGRMEFDNLTDYDNASVSVEETETKWYVRSEGEEIITNPEMMSVGISDEFEVTTEMVENYQHYKHLLNSSTKVAGEGDVSEAEKQMNIFTIRVPVHPTSIVSQFWVTIYSDNADVLQSLRASTSGMAKTFELTKNTTGKEIATQFITHWSLSIDNPEKRVGHVDGIITTLGFPNGEIPSSQRDSTLNVSALLIDNETVEEYVFNVGDKIALEKPQTGEASDWLSRSIPSHFWQCE